MVISLKLFFSFLKIQNSKSDTVIANPGVLVGLNSLLDRCNSVFLPNGEVIKRHSDTVIVVTTNNDYAGCRPMNQSVISRMNLVIDMDEPDEDTMIERVLAITGCSDKKSVRTMAQIVRSIAQYCQDNLITDGCCGIRELIAWVQTYQIHFVLKSIEPGCGIYYNTDLTGDFFPDEYCVTYCNESYITPSGESLGQRVEIEECFSSEESLLQRFHDLGYPADSYQQLKLLTEDYEIWIHQFENPYI